MTPVHLSSHLKKCSEEVLSQITPLIIPHGELFVTGSAFLDLLIWPDIDFNLIMDDDALPSVVTTFLNQKQTLELQVKRELHKKHSHLPEGTFLNINWKMPSQNLTWKLDIWIVDKKEQILNQEKMRKILSALTPEKRKFIVELKHSLLTTKGRSPPHSSYPLYEAVLFTGLTSKKAICNFLVDRGIDLN